MNFERRPAVAEDRHGLRPRAAVCFIPLGIAHTDRQAAWLAEERQRQGLEPRDELIAFCWGEPQ